MNKKLIVILIFGVALAGLIFAQSGGPSSPQMVHKVEVFTADGTWERPDGVDAVWVSGVAAGGGGGAQSRSPSYTKSGEGGGGQSVHRFPLAVDNDVTVTKGTGGSGGDTDSDGEDGGDTSFGSLLVLGGGGHGSTPIGYYGQFGKGGVNGAGFYSDAIEGGAFGSGGSGGGFFPIAAHWPAAGNASGGRGGGKGRYSRRGHGGGASAYGPGGDGGDALSPEGDSSLPGSDGPGYGSGGGGGGGSDYYQPGQQGGDGADGLLIVEWFEWDN